MDRKEIGRGSGRMGWIEGRRGSELNKERKWKKLKKKGTEVKRANEAV